MKVLIAEDDAISRKILRKTVENLGHECLVAEDGLEAWDLFQNTPDVDAIVSDWMMPNMDGIEFCRRVRESDRPGYTFFVFLTSLGGKDQLLEGMQAGADEYLIKPLDSEQLRAKLHDASRVRSLHQHLNGGSGGDLASLASRNGGEYTPADNKALVSTRRSGPSIGKNKVWDVLISQDRLSEEQLHEALEV